MWDDTYFPAGQGFGVSVRRSNDGTLIVVSVSGALDLVAAPALQNTLDEEAGRAPSKLVVDLTGVSLFSSPGAAVLLETYRGPAGDRMHLIVDSEHIRRSLELLGIADLMPVHSSIEGVVPDR